MRPHILFAENVPYISRMLHPFAWTTLSNLCTFSGVLKQTKFFPCQSFIFEQLWVM